MRCLRVTDAELCTQLLIVEHGLPPASFNVVMSNSAVVVQHYTEYGRVMEDEVKNVFKKNCNEVCD